MMRKKILGRLAFSGALFYVLVMSCSPLFAQPPDRRYSVVNSSQITSEWEALRHDVGSEEFTDTASAIKRYQHFYEERGKDSAVTAIDISSTIAQLYWQVLGDRQKALDIYDWAIQQYGELRQAKRLTEERDLLTRVNAPGGIVDVKVVIPSINSILPNLILPAENAKASSVTDGKVLLPGAVDTPAYHARSAILSGYAAQWREEKLSLDELVEQKITPQDAFLLLTSPGIITSWTADAPLRHALVEMLHNSTLLQNPKKLPASMQVSLAAYYASQKDPRSEKLYRNLLSQKVPADAWWDKIWLTNALAEYYGTMGQYTKAAETKLEITKLTADETWIGNINVEAARFYMQAGETAKAQALYAKAEKSSYGWAAGVAFLDHGRALMGQKKYDEAIKVLSTPISGQYADQIEPIKRMLIGDIYYLIGDLEKAKENMQAAIAAFYEVKNPLKGEGLENIFNSAEKRLKIINQWIKEPIQVDPAEVHIPVNAKQLQNGPVIRRLRVSTYRDVPLTVTTDNKNMTAQILSVMEWSKLSNASNNEESEKEVIIKVTSMRQNSSKALLTISSAKYAGFQALVPIYLEVGAT